VRLLPVAATSLPANHTLAHPVPQHLSTIKVLLAVMLRPTRLARAGAAVLTTLSLAAIPLARAQPDIPDLSLLPQVNAYDYFGTGTYQHPFRPAPDIWCAMSYSRFSNDTPPALGISPEFPRATTMCRCTGPCSITTPAARRSPAQHSRHPPRSCNTSTVPYPRDTPWLCHRTTRLPHGSADPRRGTYWYVESMSPQRI